jgi:hypothetical protein
VWKLPLVVMKKFSRRTSAGPRSSDTLGMWESRCWVRSTANGSSSPMWPITIWSSGKRSKRPLTIIRWQWVAVSTVNAQVGPSSASRPS